jgi:sulfite exporter TauE/SafE
MNFYVGNLILISANPWLAALLGWPIWSLLRVVGFICTGIALTALGLNFLSRFRQQPTQLISPFPRNYLWAGFGFVIADIVVKAILAPIWQKLLLFALLKPVT